VTSKQLMYAVFQGGRPDRFPVSISYTPLMQREHWQEITGEPPWTWHRWCIADPDEHVKAYLKLDKVLPLDILEPLDAPSHEERQALRVKKRADGCYRVNTRTGEEQRLCEDLAHMAPGANQQRIVFTRGDVERHVRIVPAEKSIAAGVNDYRRRAVEVMGDRMFIMAGGVTGAFWNCTFYVGETNLFFLMREEPQLIECLCERLLERTIERIRVLAAAGGDSIYIDDALTTCEMISLKDYERFSMPYTRRMVDEIHAHGMKAILIYFGGVADRVEHIASVGADGVMVETTMKNYVNDIADIAQRLGGRMVLFGNVDPVGVLWRGSEERLREAVERQAAVGRRCGRFVMSTGSPVTPGTPLARIRQFINLARAAPVR